MRPAPIIHQGGIFMPSNWLSFDSNFPSFTGEETPEQQIRALHNYLFQLREGLQYSLQNLTADNFNATALQNLSDAQKNEVAAQLQKVYTMLNRLGAEIDSLSGRVSGTENLSGRVTSVENEINYLDQRVDKNQEDITALQDAVSENEDAQRGFDERVTEIERGLPQLEQAADELADLQEVVIGEGGLQEQMVAARQELEKISGSVQVADDGSVIVGSEGKPLRLIGQVYINGVLYEQGGTT